MKRKEDTSIGGDLRSFQTTHWTAIEQVRAGHSPQARILIGELLQAYWKPVYRYLRHPQYAGLILIILGFNIQWPTLLTLLMAPVLVVMYVRLARQEDRILEAEFGEMYRAYALEVPAFLPRRQGKANRALP
jgi:protein-S-isoprenylcysteine O-methyltransferase Ste14